MGNVFDILGKVGGLADDALNFVGNQVTNAQNRSLMREQNAFNANEAQKNRDFQAQEAQIARDWQEQQYNQYSSPQAMVRQYQEAGLNPALMYGQNLQSGTGSSPVPSGSSASGSAAVMNAPQFGNIVQNLATLAKIKQDIAESKSREAANYADADKSYSSIRVDNASIKNLGIQNERMLSQISNENKKVSAEVRFINGQLSRIVTENKVSSKQIEEIDARIRQMSHQNALTDQQKLTLAAQQTLFEFQAEESYLRQNEIISKTRLNNVQSGLIPLQEWEQRFKNKYLSLYGRYPSAESVTEARRWMDKQGKNFEPYD